jgi:hypothetical protein
MTVFANLPDLYTLIGVFGAFAYISNYTALSFQKVTSDSVRYYAVNSCAAFCVMTSMLAQLNMPSLMIQGFYLSVSLFAVVLRLWQRHQATGSLLRSA